MRAFLPILLCLASGCGAGRNAPGSIVVSAAISLKEPLDEIAALYERRYEDYAVRFNYGASGLLATQIERGAPVDVFASASDLLLDELEAGDLLLPGTRQTLAANRLVVLAGAETSEAGRTAREIVEAAESVAIGNPRTVPAGFYARECLEHLSLWESLGPRLIFAEHARQLVDYVVRGEVGVALGYTTDARVSSGSVRVAAELPETCQEGILYGIAVVSSSRLPFAARAFIELATGSEGQRVFSAHGFPVVAP